MSGKSEKNHFQNFYWHFNFRSSRTWINLALNTAPSLVGTFKLMHKDVLLVRCAACMFHSSMFLFFPLKYDYFCSKNSSKTRPCGMLVLMLLAKSYTSLVIKKRKVKDFFQYILYSIYFLGRFS